MAKKILSTKDTVKATDGADMTVDDLRSRICEAAQQDKRFNKAPKEGNGKSCFGIWVQDLILSNESSISSAVIQAMDGKLYQVDVSVSDNDVELGVNAKEVTRKTQYIKASLINYESNCCVNGIAIKAADGHVEGKPSMNSRVENMRGAVADAISSDKRFKTGVNSNGTIITPANETWNKPYVVDVLVPDDDGKHHAVIRRDDSKLVKHAFDYDAETDKATMDDGDSSETECTPVYTSAITDYLTEMVDLKAKSKAAEEKTASPAEKKSDIADSASVAAHEASAKAHESGDEDDHKNAADLHDTASKAHSNAMIAHAKAGNTSDANAHAKQMSAHDSAADAHRMAPCEARDASIEQLVIKAGLKDEAKKIDFLYCHESAPISASSKWSMDGESEFQWMPGGVKTVTASWKEKPLTITVNCTKKTAELVQASFDRIKAKLKKRKPFGCVEHREEEAALHPSKFSWKEGDESGVYCSALPTDLGVRNVNGRIHTAWSPCFDTDAEYNKVKTNDEGKSYFFPDGVRGSKTNPANVIGTSFNVGSLTNKPAFRDIAPISAKEAKVTEDPIILTASQRLDSIFAALAEQANPPAKLGNGANTKGKTMKLHLIKAHGTYTQLGEVDVKAEDAALLLESGHAITTGEYNSREAVKASSKKSIESAIERAIKRKAIAPKDETVKAAHIGYFDKGEASADIIVKMIDDMRSEADQQLESRFVPAFLDEDGNRRILAGETTVQEACVAVVKAREPLDGLMKNGSVDSIKAAGKISRETAVMLKRFVMPEFDRGGDFMLREVIKGASDVTDPNSQVGTISSTLLLMRNMGYLKNKLNFMQYITTDLRNEPAKFNQTVMTRYITPPNVLVYVPGIGYTSDVTTINAYVSNLGTNKAIIGSGTQSGTTQSSGTLTGSVPSTTDINVVINNHNGVEITFPTSTLDSTIRNLFAEQQGAQMYSLAEFINKVFLATMFSSTWAPAATPAAGISLGVNFGLPGVIKIKTNFTLNKMPDVGRFALLHSIYHDQILTDSNLLSAKAILSLIKKDAGSFEDGELPTLFGVKVLESQLSAYKTNAAPFLGLQTPTDPSTIGTVAPNGIGFAGNSASACFVARIPQDYTTVFKDIPATAAIDIITEPDSGISMMVVKHVNHSLAQVSCRCALMFGFAQGDPRQGFLLLP